MLVTQLATIFGVAVVAHIGNKILIKVQQPDLAQVFDIVIMVGTSLWVIKLIKNAFDEIVNTFGWML